MDALIVNFQAVRRAVHQLGRVGSTDQRQHVVAAVVHENRQGRNGMAVAFQLQQLAMHQQGRPGGAA